jgi:hypothetical protein
MSPDDLHPDIERLFFDSESAWWICSDESGHIWEEIVPHPSRLEIAVNSNLVA